MILLNNQVVEFQRFPNNEKRLDIDVSTIKSKNLVVWQYENDESIFEFLMFADTLSSMYLDRKIPREVTFDLRIPYMPYSRMDRVKEVNTCFTLKTLISVLKQHLYMFNTIEILDLHSPVTLDLFVQITGRLNSFSEMKMSLHREVLKGFDLDNTWVVFPDEGAQVRYAEDLNIYPNVIVCEKKRDFETGQILGISANIVKQSSLDQPKSAIIIDDLCSYGGTFIGCKQAITDSNVTPDEWVLCVTHSEKAMLDGKVLEEFDKVYTTNSIQDSRRHNYSQIFEFDVLTTF